MSMHHPKERSRSLEDFILCVATAAIIVLAAGYYGVFQALRGRSPNDSAKWLGLAVETFVLFGYTISSFRSAWTRLKLWLLLASFLAVHCVVWLMIVTNESSVPAPMFGLSLVFEYFALVLYIGLFL